MFGTYAAMKLLKRRKMQIPFRSTADPVPDSGSSKKLSATHLAPVLLSCLFLSALGGRSDQDPTTAASQQRASTSSVRSAPAIGSDVYTLEDTYLNWPVAPSEHPYMAIDGKHLHDYVSEITAISRRYRDNGHPQFWGRLEGTEGDVESAQWVFDKLKKAGLTDVRMQQFDLPPQWMPQSWEVIASSGGKTLNIATAQPAVRSVGTQGAGLDLEAVYVGLGNMADFAGRDVRGKAVFIFSMPEPGVWAQSAQYNGSIQRAEDGGAAAIFDVICLPGNIRSEFPLLRAPVGAAPRPGAPPVTADTLPIGMVPAFTVGYEDGEAMRAMIESAPSGQAPHVKVRLDVQMVPNLKSSNVWGVLPGMTDEKIIVIAHRDCYFEGAGDNASGMATLIGLAEYFTKIPKDKRHRTIEFVGTTGHHGTAVGVRWMADNKDTVLAKTALVMNAEHTALTQQYLFAGKLRPANTTNAEHWNFNGSQRLIDIAVKSFGAFGVPTYTGTDRVAMAEISPIAQLVPSFGVINVDTYYHTDGETIDKVPWTGLGAITRAFAKIIDDVNKVEIKDLQKASSSSSGQ
jgi:hypothetical protein